MGSTSRILRGAAAAATGFLAAAVAVESGFRLADLRAPRHDRLDGLLPRDSPRDTALNRYGYHDYDWQIETPPGTYRAVFLGDSFTMGIAVPRDETHVERLERSLNERCDVVDRYELVNMAKDGWTTPLEVEALAEHLEEGLRPDLVVMVFFINDATQMGTNYRLAKPLHEMLYVRDGWLNRRSVAYDYLDYLVKRRRVNDLTVTDYIESFRRGDKSQAAWASCMRALQGARRLANRYDFELILVSFPVLIELHEGHRLQAVYDTVRDFCATIDVPAFDLLPSFYGYEPSSLWVSPVDAHPNSEAHAIAARGFEELLLENGLIPCGSKDG